MYLEFKLPAGNGGMAAGYRNMHLKKRVQAWADQHNITVVNYTNGYRCCFEFGKDRDYTLFALSWQVNSPWDEFTVVSSK